MQDEDEDDFHELPEELELPEGVVDADQAIEVLRAWVADGSLHVIFDPETFRHDVSEWGRLLADIAHHVSHAVELDGQMDRASALAHIQQAFEVNIEASDVAATGKIKGRTEH
ncbi:MAG: DUF5076 domain-containing protein [Alphaproteobacteria bacterium]|nr:DUF5076 domain-containing protein [Alphaproteobacteria bacterium]